MRALIPLASFVCCFAATDPAMLQQGVDVGNNATVGWGVGSGCNKVMTRRREYCSDYPRRRNSRMHQWCWGPSYWPNCGKFGTYSNCRSGGGKNPLCFQDPTKPTEEVCYFDGQCSKGKCCDNKCIPGWKKCPGTTCGVGGDCNTGKCRWTVNNGKKRCCTAVTCKLGQCWCKHLSILSECDWDDQCYSKYCSGNKKCQTRKNPGQTCSKNAGCNTGKCQKTVNRGTTKCCSDEHCFHGDCWCSNLGDTEECDWGDQCNSRLCRNKKCQTRKKELGQTCSLGTDCNTGKCGRISNIRRGCCSMKLDYNWCSNLLDNEECKWADQCQSRQCIGKKCSSETLTCFTLTHPILPGELFSFKKCSGGGSSSISATVTNAASRVTLGGQLNFPCASFDCAPSGGQISIEYQIWPARKTNGKSDDHHGEIHTGVVQFQGSIGASISIEDATEAGGGAKVGITVSGRLALDFFDGLASADGTISGTLTLHNFKVYPTFGWSRCDLGLVIKCSVRIGYAEFNVAITAKTDGGWSVSFDLAEFFGNQIETAAQHMEDQYSRPAWR